MKDMEKNIDWAEMLGWDVVSISNFQYIEILIEMQLLVWLWTDFNLILSLNSCCWIRSAEAAGCLKLTKQLDFFKGCSRPASFRSIFLLNCRITTERCGISQPLRHVGPCVCVCHKHSKKKCGFSLLCWFEILVSRPLVSFLGVS